MFAVRVLPVRKRAAGTKVACCIVTRAGRIEYLKRTLAALVKQDVAILLWVNGDCNLVRTQLGPVGDRLAYFHAHHFNVGQHIAHNAMLDECVKLGVDWHIRVDDDCWISTRTWLKRLLALQEKIRELRGKYAVFGIQVDGLDNPPPAVRSYEIGREVIESVEILGGILRMSPMPMVRYFRWDERQAMGFGDATQFKSFCESAGVDMFRVRTIRCTHGDSTQKQKERNSDWDHEHDMLQYVPLGL